jgi:hypothetical protein
MDLSSDKVVLGCKHAFHLTCVKSLHSARCPMCRAAIEIGAAISEDDVRNMNKRKRQDAEEADRTAAEQALSGDYIGPGTRRSRLGMDALLQLFGSHAQICALEEDVVCTIGHRVLHRGALAQQGVSCKAVRDLISSTRLLFSSSPDELPCDAALLSWLTERLPTLPPAVVHQMAHQFQEDQPIPCHVIDAHIRNAWRVLVSTQLLQSAIDSMQ